MENKKLKQITIEDNESFLRQLSMSVDIKHDNDLSKDIEVLEEFCKENEVMAMAAIQLGIPKRLVYLKNTNLDIINKLQSNEETEEDRNYNEARVLINPILHNERGLTEYWENCASCLDNMGRVLRPYMVDIQYFDIDGNIHNETFEGFEATVLSHEMDHLDGILHIDIAEEIINMPKEERKKWRQTHGYKIYNKSGEYESLKNKNSKKKILK